MYVVLFINRIQVYSSYTPREIISKYKHIAIPLSRNYFSDTNMTFVIRGKPGFFRMTPKFQVNATISKNEEGSIIDFILFCGCSYVIIFLFGLTCFLTILLDLLSSGTCSFIPLFLSMSLIAIDIGEVLWQRTEVFNCLETVAQ